MHHWILVPHFWRTPPSNTILAVVGLQQGRVGRQAQLGGRHCDRRVNHSDEVVKLCEICRSECWLLPRWICSLFGWQYSKHTRPPNQHRSGKSAMLLVKPWFSIPAKPIPYVSGEKNSFGCFDMFGLKIVCYHAHGRRPPRLFVCLRAGWKSRAGSEEFPSRFPPHWAMVYLPPEIMEWVRQIGSSSLPENGEKTKFMFQSTNQSPSLITIINNHH